MKEVKEARQYWPKVIIWLVINPTFIGLGETSSYWSVQFFLFFICHHTGSKPTGTDQNGSNYRIGQDCAGRAQLQYLIMSLCFVTISIIYLMKLDDACANFTPEVDISSYS